MVPGTGVQQNATVTISNGKILAINETAPDTAITIDGKGKWLIPGLIDMHVHTLTDGHFNTNYPTRTASIFTSTQDIMTPFVANGVTTIMDLNSMPGHFGQRNEILHGDVTGPRMALSALINGGEGDGRIANTPSNGRQTVRNAKAEGYEFIKVYSQLDTATYKAIVDEAAKQGMKVVGHIPNAFRGRTKEAFVPGFGLIAHGEELYKQTNEHTEKEARRFARLAKANGTWLSPTLTIIVWAARQASSLESIRSLNSLQYVHPLMQDKWLTANNYNRGSNPDRIARLEQIKAFNNLLVRTFKEEGVPMLAGTDAGSSGVVWGFSLHEELELLVAAGLSPREAITAATRLPAEWLGIDSIIGTVEPGKFADLVLLNDNPLTDIRNTQKIAGVFVNGRWLNRSHIDKMLEDLSKRNTANKGKYQWKLRKEY